MRSAAESAEQRLRTRLQHQAARCTARALATYTPVLRAYAQRSEPPGVVESYVSVLKNARDRRVGFRDGQLLAYAHALVELLANIGSGSEVRSQKRLLELFESIGTELHESGCATTDLRLITARFCSTISNGGERRRKLIDLAWRESGTDDEKLRALLVLAKYSIDISDYKSAHRYLAECDAVADRAPSGDAQRYDIHTTRGIADFYRDHAVATESLLRGVAWDKAPTDPVICRATASALHYLGRIRAAARDRGTALAFLVLAQHCKDQMYVEGSQLGYYHLRLGEILLAGGHVEAGHWHLQRAGTLFQNVRERSTGEAHLSTALAGIATAAGDFDQAEYLLTGAIETARRDGYPRGQLMFLAQLFAVRLRRGAILGAARIALSALRLWPVAEPGGWRWVVNQARSLILPRVLMGYTPAGRKRTPQVTRCPCSQHDAVPVDELFRRTGLQAR